MQTDNKIKNIFIIGITTGIIFILIGIILISSKSTSDEKKAKNKKNDKVITKTSKKEKKDNVTIITVNIKGEVKNPGIYNLKKGERIADLIKKAGGFTNNADENKVNLAYKLKDGDTVFIPKKGENITIYETVITQKKIENYKPKIYKNKTRKHKKIKSTNKKLTTNKRKLTKNTSTTKPTKVYKTKENKPSKLNINTASKQQLLNIPGITDEIADNIIEFKKINGKIYSIDDLILINGIDEKKLKEIKNYITVK